MSGLERKGVSTLRAMIAAAVACVAVSSAAFAQDTTAPAETIGDKMSFSGGVSFTSHFISFGADVWGGGNEWSPFGAKSTAFAYGTVTAKITDELSGFVNLWSDLNDNVDSNIGGPIQEIDANFGLTYTLDKWTFGATYAYWMFGGGAEKAIEGSVSYADADLWKDAGVKGFALNPSLLVHYRYDSTGDLAGENAAVIQAGVNPSFTFMEDGDYPITLSVPFTAGYFTDAYQGGDGAGFGYFSAGLERQRSAGLHSEELRQLVGFAERSLLPHDWRHPEQPG
ncbi:MAG: hypothetical protein QM754_19515 [Tepidisphaeraceae bacterium]